MTRYGEILDYLVHQLPMYQRSGPAAYKGDLSRTRALCEILHNPQHKFKSIHVAGTNGKGSVSSLLASVFQEAGYKTGLYTSPHLKDFRERIRIDGNKIAKENVVGFIEKYRPLFDPLNPSFFEITTAMAFDWFAEQEVDIAILETGLGGRLDSTNVVDPEISIITNISLDHMQFLGDTIEKIALEKAGIIKPGRPVVIGPGNRHLRHVFQSVAITQNAKVYFADDSGISALNTDLGGIYQQQNTRTAHLALQVLAKAKWKISAAHIAQGALRVKTNTGIRGRWELLRQSNPRIICDVGHNEDGIKEVAKMLATETYQHLHMVFGMVQDKDAAHILPILPADATYYFCRPNVPRGMDADALRQAAEKLDRHGSAYATVEAAIDAACSQAGDSDLIFIGGSFFVVAETLLKFDTPEENTDN